ncbi:hypothetical protein [Anaeroselena agilis]|uniref:Uncharacterized protein n=1 Tax=Anaeroselena agilis TaxID=3063788 RepID=A0ABU3NV32_9FIRM|nr:hypothetical protein [Selenomonadales bacterium 4137-cl]
MLEAFATNYENYPALVTISQLYGVLSFDAELGAKVREIVAGRHRFLVEIVAAGIAAGDLADTNPEALADALGGIFHSVCLKWQLSGHGFSLREKVLSEVGIVLSAFIPKNGEDRICPGY